MGSKMFLLLVLVPLMFTDDSQGNPETPGQSLIVNKLTEVSADREPLITANPNNIPRQHKRLCNCKGNGSEAMSTRCHCQQPARRSKHRKPKRCQKNKKCKHGKQRKFVPSVPI